MTKSDDGDLAEFDTPPEELLRRLAAAEPARLITPPARKLTIFIGGGEMRDAVISDSRFVAVE